MHATPLHAVIAAIVVSGCLGATQGTGTGPSSDAAPTGTAPAPPDNVTQAPSVVRFGLLGPAVTRNDSVDYYVNTDASLSVSLRLDGNETAGQVVTGNRTWTLPLGFGAHRLEAKLEAAGFHKNETTTLVRLALSKITVDYGDYHPSSPGMAKSDQRDVWFNVDDRPSAAQYVAHGAKHVDQFTAHDQLQVFQVLTGKKVEFVWSASFNGFTVSKIDGAGNPVDSSAPPWWCYTVNDKSADGISIQPVRPGDNVKWTLGTCA